jgi:hypothetical protein
MEIHGNLKKFMEIDGHSPKFIRSLWKKFIGFFWKLLENRDFLNFFATYLYGHSRILFAK